MAESLKFNKDATKADIYAEILPQIKSVIEHEENLVANLSNIAAILTEAFGHWWTGFYLRDGNTLVLGPFQGPLACTRIPVEPIPRGVCGAAAAEQKTQLVPDVEKFPGHIACSAASKSEIVVPLVANGLTELVLDIDSAYLNSFDETDQVYLEQLIDLIKDRHYASVQQDQCRM
jgi:L-methionine (R)-S-oxide reductase